MDQHALGDVGLAKAIQAAGGVTELARRIGISQPSVSNWLRIPAERVLSVEVATGVPRAILRPDLYGEPPIELHEVDDARAQEYSLLAVLLMRAPEAAMLRRLGKLRGGPTPIGAAHAGLAEAAKAASVQGVEREYFNLFIGIGRGELLPYGSYYLTGFLNERPLARLREDLSTLGVEPVEEQAEPEDHAGILCEIMSGLIAGHLPISSYGQRQFFERHLEPWIGNFFADLEAAEAGVFYRSVGTLGRCFLEIEQQAFALPE